MPQLDAEEGEAEALELGDIVISLETAARQAPEHGHDLRQELLFLATHGLLHLLGWDHPDDASLAAMLARQEQLLKQP
jgi:probable rRNA maturation factor